MKFIESYKNSLLKFSFISKMSSFLLANFLFIEFGNNSWSIFSTPDFFENNFISCISALSFQIFIAFLFAFRFALLWSNNLKTIWFSQLTWLITWLAIIGYNLTTKKLLFGSAFSQIDFHCLDCFYNQTFIYASSSLTVILLGYMFLSPIKEILVLLNSFLKKK